MFLPWNVTIHQEEESMEIIACVIRNTIQEFYIQEKKVPTIPKLLPIIKKKIHFRWGCKSLERNVKSLGFK
jgi:hypothetical protein